MEPDQAFAIVAHLEATAGGYRFAPAASDAVLHPTLCLTALQHLRNARFDDAALAATSSQNLPLPHSIRIRLMRSRPDFAKAVLTHCQQGEPIAFDFSRRCSFGKLDGPLSDHDWLAQLFFAGVLTLPPDRDDALVCPNYTALNVLASLCARL